MDPRDQAPQPIELMDQAFRAERLGKFDEARELLRRAVVAGGSAGGLDARLRLGKLLVFGGHAHLAEAEAVLNEARGAAERNGAPRQAAVAIHLFALLERGRGRLDRAAELLNESPITRQPAAPGPSYGQWFHYRGLIEADRGDLNYGERLLYRALQVYQEAHFEPGLSEVDDSLANLLLRRGRSHAALAFARRSLEIKRKLGDRYGEAITLGTVGRVLQLQARYAEAAEAFEQDLAIARELGDARGMGIMLNSLGDVARLRKDLDAAIGFYHESLATDRGPYNVIHTELGLIHVHLDAGRIDDAEAACDRAAGLLEANPKVHGLADALTGFRGAVAWRRGDFIQGDHLIDAAVKALAARNQALDTVPFLYELRDLSQARGDTAGAVAVMTRALDLLADCGSERGVADVENWLRTVDEPGLTRLALQRHFPGYLVQEILSGRMSRPQPRRMAVTVLFCDVRNYTTMSEGLEPEQVVGLLNEWFTEATRAILRYGGVVDKFIGDAIMAVFGMPEPRDDAAADAVRAALEMRDALASLNLRRKALDLKEFQVGVGINTGEAVVGFIGSHLQQSFAAIGDVTNTASRLESATKNYPGCDILIGESTEQAQRRHRVAETTCLGLAALKGKDHPVAVYQVLGPCDPAP